MTYTDGLDYSACKECACSLLCASGAIPKDHPTRECECCKRRYVTLCGIFTDDDKRVFPTAQSMYIHSKCPRAVHPNSAYAYECCSECLELEEAVAQ